MPSDMARRRQARSARRLLLILEKGSRESVFPFPKDGRAVFFTTVDGRPDVPISLGSTADAVLSLAKSRYRSGFRTAFDAEPSLELIAKALASYLRTIVDGNSAVDRFAAGNSSALTTSARRGHTLFNGKAGCGQCHSGTNFTDEEFHNTGVAWHTGVVTDEGRARAARKVGQYAAQEVGHLRAVHSTCF
jgi:cytochrome c peroxidase